MKNDFIEFEHNRDNRAIEGIRERISLANEWADEIYNTINSDKQLSRPELTALKRRALKYIAHLVTIEDPRTRLTLHMEYNQELALSLTRQLEQALTVALKRLKSCVDVIDNSNKKASHKLIATLKDACYPGKYEEAKDWFIKMGLCDPDTLFWKDKKNGHKTALANYLWSLHGKGFTRELDATEIMNIAENTFGVKMGISTVQHAH